MPSKSKKERLREARERAAQFAERDKEKLERKRKSNADSKASPRKKAKTSKIEESPAKQTAAMAKKSPKNKSTPAERKKIARENAKAFAERDRVGLKSRKKTDNSNAASSTFGAVIDPNQVAAYEEQAQVQFVTMMQTDQQRLQKGKNGSNDDSDEEIDEEVMPAPPKLMAQVSQQVLLNAHNEGIAEDSEQKEWEEGHVISSDNTGVSHTDPSIEIVANAQANNSQAWRFAKRTLVMIFLIATFSSIIMLPMPSAENMVAPEDTEAPKESFCYFNSNPDHEKGCSENISGMQCPEGAECHGGKVIACLNVFQDVSDNGDKCVLREEHLVMKAALMDQLVSHTSQICETSSKPSFKYITLQKGQPDILEDENEDLAKALSDEGFVIYERDVLYVGLPEGFKVNLPIYCFLGNIGQWILQEIGLLLLGILRFSTSNLLGFVTTYPKLSVLILCLLFVIMKFRKYRATKNKRQTDTTRMRDIAYKTLEESGGIEHCAVHIRDEIAMALYPNSKKSRLELQKHIWPKIVDDIKRDTRVRKFQTFNKDGNTREMWQWTAARKSTKKS